MTIICKQHQSVNQKQDTVRAYFYFYKNKIEKKEKGEKQREKKTVFKYCDRIQLWKVFKCAFAAPSLYLPTSSNVLHDAHWVIINFTYTFQATL